MAAVNIPPDYNCQYWSRAVPLKFFVVIIPVISGSRGLIVKRNATFWGWECGRRKRVRLRLSDILFLLALFGAATISLDPVSFGPNSMSWELEWVKVSNTRDQGVPQ